MTLMTIESISAAVFTAALCLFAMILAFNLGRLDVASKARQCHSEMTYQIPFKGTLP